MKPWEVDDTLEREKLAEEEETVAPQAAIIEITLDCPMRCTHCFAKAWKNDYETLRALKWYKILDKLKNVGVKNLTIEGGEPTIHPDFYDILEYATSQFDEVTVQTSGVVKKTKLSNYDCNVAVSIEYATPRLNNKIRRRTDPEKYIMDNEKGIVYHKKYKKTIKEIGKDFSQGNVKDMDRYAVSMVSDPIEKKENAFSMAMNKLKSIDNPKVIRSTIYSDNDPVSIAMRAEKIGANSVFIPLKPIGLGKNLKNKIPGVKKLREDTKMMLKFNETHKMNHIIDYPDWYLQKIRSDVMDEDGRDRLQKIFSQRNRVCGAGVHRIFIQHDGTVTPCPFLDQEMGNLLEDDINDVYKNMYEWNQEAQKVSESKRCDNCLGGCLAVNYANSKLKENTCIFRR